MADVFIVIAGYGVVTARMPRVTTQQPPARKPNAPGGTVMLDRGEGVFRTGGIEPAIAYQQGAYGVTVAP